MDGKKYPYKHPLKVPSEPGQTSKMELFVKIVNGWKPVNYFCKILDLWLGSEYTFVFVFSWLTEYLDLIKSGFFYVLCRIMGIKKEYREGMC